jgi:hypothetical protein
MDINDLVDAVYEYRQIRNKYGDLSKVNLSQLNDDFRTSLYSSHEMQPCTRSAKVAFDAAQHQLEQALNLYIESRVRAVLESINKSSNTYDK